VRTAVDRLEKISAENLLVRAGISPHTLYTVGEDLLRSLADLAAARRLPPVSTSESPRRRRRSFPTGRGDRLAPVPRGGEGRLLVPRSRADDPAYLAEAGLLREGVLLVHNVHLARPEIDALRAGGARFVLCPRSNAAHGNGSPDVTHFVDTKIPFALGTDSLGSVPDLSPWEEMRAAAGLYRGRKRTAALCRELFRAATEHATAALGLPGESSPRVSLPIFRSWTTPEGTATDSSGHCWRRPAGQTCG